MLSFHDQVKWLDHHLRSADNAHFEDPTEFILRTSPFENREQLERACLALVQKFCEGKEQAGSQYGWDLLLLAKDLRLPLGNFLMDAVRKFPEWPKFPQHNKQVITAVLVDLALRLPFSFWKELLLQEEGCLSTFALAGMLEADQNQAVAMLPNIPPLPRLAECIACVLELHSDTIDPAQRDVWLSGVRSVVSSCNPMLRKTLQEWLQECHP